MSRPRVSVPDKAAPGETIQIKTLISHPMESGQRQDSSGNPIPRHIVNRLVCTFNGEEVFATDLHPAIAANPYIEFSARVDESGTFRFAWTDDDGSVYEAESEIEVA